MLEKYFAFESSSCCIKMARLCIALLALGVLHTVRSASAKASSSPKIPTLSLGNGVEMPMVGYGTFLAKDAELEKALDLALEAGYRHIDTAYLYDNERVIGKVLKKWLSSGKLQRKDIFLVTKLPPNGNRASTVEKYLKKALAALQVDYVDLFLIHTPFAFKDVESTQFSKQANGDLDLDVNTDHIATWKEMEKQVDAGLTKAIGVSNFNKTQLNRLLENSRIKPSNLQVEIHAYHQQNELVDFCKQHGVTVTAYSPIGSPALKKLFAQLGKQVDLPDLLHNPVVKKIADKHKKTTAQVLLRFTNQRGIAVIPKSTNIDRLKQNINLFDFTLDDQDLKDLKALDAHARIIDFLAWQGVEKHPEYPFPNELKKH